LLHDQNCSSALFAVQQYAVLLQHAVALPSQVRPLKVWPQLVVLPVLLALPSLRHCAAATLAPMTSAELLGELEDGEQRPGRRRHGG
jgi:hypothetical protein